MSTRSVYTCILLLVTASRSGAQFNYYKLSVSAQNGLNHYYGDIDSFTPLGYSGAIAFGWHLSPYLHTGIEIQQGSITGGDSIHDPHQRFFRNRYTHVSLYLQLFPSVLLRMKKPSVNRASGPYMRMGVGIIFNRLQEIKRSHLNSKGTVYAFPGENQGIDQGFPAEIGFVRYFNDRWNYPRTGVHLSYQFTVTAGEGLDGYADPPSRFHNRSPDMYSVVSIRISYLFGPVGFYW